MASNFPGYIQPQGGGRSAPITSGGATSGASAAELLVDGSFLTAEPISGATIIAGAAFTQSGTVQTAMASVSGRMPCIGAIVNNYASGVLATVYRYGRLFNAAISYSGWMNQPVYVGRSGQLVASGAPQFSGDIQQIVGVSCQQSGIMLQLGDALEGVVAGSGDIGSGAVTGQAGGGYFVIASGTISTNDVGSGAILSGLIASGQVGRFHLNSGCAIDLYACEQAISGVIAVALGSGGCFVVPAERQSGLRLPAIGVVAGNFASGAVVPVVRTGRIGYTFSGAVASGAYGYPLYVGSGGLLVNLSGFMGGASSGVGPNQTVTGGMSGQLVQRIAVPMSGGLYVRPDSEVTSGLNSGSLGQW